MNVLGVARITPGVVSLNGRTVFRGTLNDAYRHLVGDYPKFFKMDGHCKAGFLGAELLLRDLPIEDKENGAIVLFGNTGSVAADRAYQNTIASIDNFFPSPALFVYTLANIVTGEIAIRHKVYGETSFYILRDYQPGYLEEVVEECLAFSSPTFILTGWIDYEDDESYFVEFKLISK